MNEESEKDKKIDLYSMLWLDLAMMLIGFMSTRYGQQLSWLTSIFMRKKLLENHLEEN
jgi:hypothetical protein